MRLSLRSFWGVMLAAVTACGALQAEQGILVVHVSDLQHRPMRGVVLSTKGDGSTGPATDSAGKTRIRLAQQTQPWSWVSLQVVRSPAGQDLVFISPYDRQALVPPFENETKYFVPVVLAQRGDRVLLESGKALEALAAKINAANAPRVGKEITDEDREAVLLEVARQHGLEPNEIDRALRAWGKKTEDPYQAGLAAIYERNYPEATEKLTESLYLRKRELEEAEAKAEEAKAGVVDSAIFLGQSLYYQGKYRESVGVLREAAAQRKNDSLILNRLGVSLFAAGDYSKAESLFERALQIRETDLGLDHPDVAKSLSNLALVYLEQAKYEEAEPLLKRALSIMERARGPDHLDVAIMMGNLAALYVTQERLDEAEPLVVRALEITEKAVGADHVEFAYPLTHLAGIHMREFEYDEAESSFKRALSIMERARGPDHPDVASILRNLGIVYVNKEMYEEAESSFKRALRILERPSVLDHPGVPLILAALGGLYFLTEMYEEAEPLFKRALTIAENTLGPDHPTVATILEFYAMLLRETNRETEAEGIEMRARALRGKYKH